MHDTRDTATPVRRRGNGRSPAENKIYAQLGRRGLSRQQELDAAAAMQQGRRRAAGERVLARLGPIPGDQLEREIDKELDGQLMRMRAAALTSKRKAREAAEKLAEAERDLDASGLLDAGSDGIDAA